MDKSEFKRWQLSDLIVFKGGNMRTIDGYHVFQNDTVSESELSNEIKLEISALNGLDIFTNRHVLGVVNKTSRMCKKMKYSYEDMKKCVLSAYLHDVGKIKIPPEVLQKNGKLTNEEYEIIKKHTIFGYEICMEYPHFKSLARIVRAHHENLDGTGYPDGLKNSEIPEEAKLLKVADVFDALTQKRQYKDGFKESDALSMMKNDVKNGKMDEYYYHILVEVVIEGLNEKLKNHIYCIEQYKNELYTLRELEQIYKEIYDKGLNQKLEKKIKRYDLAPGYDMTTNANLLSMKKMILEKEIELKDFTIKELNLIKKL